MKSVKFFLFLLLFIFSVNLFINTASLLAQDSTKKDYLWFTEFQIANSSGFTLDLFNQGDLAIGRRIFKNVDLRLVGGYYSNDYEETGYESRISYNNNDNYSAGIDILYRIKIVKDLLFKGGIGYEYKFSKSERSSSQNSYENEIYSSNYSVSKYYDNYYKAIGIFSYSFTNNIYIYVQTYLRYGNSHYTNYDTSFYNNGYEEFLNTNSYDGGNSSFNMDNLTLGGGISF